MNKGLGRYSFGIGDRFGKEGEAQLRAILKMKEQGVEVTPVWNKSNREHKTVGTKPSSTREEADVAVKNLGYTGSYLVDADHINLDNVAPYIDSSDFFTIDVAQFIGKDSPDEEIKKFLEFFTPYSRCFFIEGIDQKVEISGQQLEEMTNNFLFAMKRAGEVYAYIKSAKNGKFFTEVSIDEVEQPQTPVELFFILAALAFYEVPVDTIAPKFTGEFNKGVDYRGDLEQFKKEFEEDLMVLKFAVREFNFSENLKMSVHSGSDKFSIYPVIRELIKKHDAGLHLKTAGTTWLEELIGLAESEGEGFRFAKALYAEALERYSELTKDYTSVLSIEKEELPSPEDFETGRLFADALRHDQSSKAYNPNFRQLLHCAYKIAAEKGELFFPLLETCRIKIETNVTYNLYKKHLNPLFI